MASTAVELPSVDHSIRG